MKKIGLLIDTLIGGGAERIVLNFAETFSDLGHEVHIILLKNVIEHEIDLNFYTVHYLSEDGVLAKNKWLNKIRMAKKLQQKVLKLESDNQKFDLFISNSEDMDLVGRKAKLDNFCIRYRNSMYEYYYSKFKDFTGFKRFRRQVKYKWQFKNRYNNQNIVTVSKALIEDITHKMGVKPRVIKNIYNPFDFDKIRQKGSLINKKIPNDKYIVYVAKFENRKNQILLLEAYKKSNIKLPLVLIGDVHTDSDRQYLSSIKEKIKELNIESQVLFPGFQVNPYPWIKNAELFAMSSNSEGLPLVLVESFILGTKVVSTDCPTGPNELLIGEFSQFLSPVGDIEKLANNITKALRDYPEMPTAFLDKFKSKYSVKQYLDLIKKF